MGIELGRCQLVLLMLQFYEAGALVSNMEDRHTLGGARRLRRFWFFGWASFRGCRLGLWRELRWRCRLGWRVLCRRSTCESKRVIPSAKYSSFWYNFDNTHQHVGTILLMDPWLVVSDSDA
jgi:hypothetical protein